MRSEALAILTVLATTSMWGANTAPLSERNARPAAPPVLAPVAAAPEPLTQKVYIETFRRAFVLPDPRQQKVTIDGFWLGMVRGDVEHFTGRPDHTEPAEPALDECERRGAMQVCHYGELTVGYFVSGSKSVVVLLEGPTVAVEGRSVRSRSEAEALGARRSWGSQDLLDLNKGVYFRFEPGTGRIKSASVEASSPE